MDGDGAGALERFQAFDNRRQFHAVVGGGFFAARQFLFMMSRPQDRRPAAWPWISRTGAIGKDINGRAAWRCATLAWPSLRDTHSPYSRACLTLLWKRSFLEY